MPRFLFMYLLLQVVEKMSSNSTSSTHFDTNSVLQFLKPIVDDSITSNIPQVDATVCRIKDKKHISRLVLELNEKLPVPSLQHLKRVYKDEILLYLSSEKGDKSLLETTVDVTGLDLTSVRQVKVPLIPPKTRNQYIDASRTWPCAFHEDKYIEKLLSNRLFNASELEEHCTWMREAIVAAERSQTPVGAVVVEPVTKTVLAVASDDRESNPMKHSVMVVVDLVARTQGGGLWPVKEGDFVCSKDAKKLTVIHSKRNQDGVEKPVGPYLCTGYDLYITREPCTMCAMALVHSRVRRVFYGSVNKSGALGTLTKVHLLKDLNHRYEVFKGLLVKECDRLYNKVD